VLLVHEFVNEQSETANMKYILRILIKLKQTSFFGKLYN